MSKESVVDNKVDYDQYNTAEVEQVKGSRWGNFKDSFKRAEFSQYDVENMTDAERAAVMTAKSPLARRLKSRHLQMISIGGSIGTGLFIGSGATLHSGGPASLLIGFAIIGAMLFCVMQALGELAVVFPVSGAFSTYATRFIHPSVGFAVGWNYAIQWLTVFPLELIAASMTIGYWQRDQENPIDPVAWVGIFYALVVLINFFGVKGYGEAEFVFSIIKVMAVIGFIILGIVINTGGVVGSDQGYIGGKYWHNPGAFNHGFKGLCSVFVNAAFSFAGTELAGLAAAETQNPRKTLPTACKQVFWRILLFYIVSLTIVGLLVPYTDDELLGSSSVDITASPFVIAIERAKIKVLPSIINAVILISVLSVGNSSVFGSSRTMAALADQGFAPRFLGYVDRSGRPLYAIIVTLIFGLLCFMAGSKQQPNVFNWLYALSGLSLIFTWGSISVAHIRFRYAYKAQNRSTDDVPFKAHTGIIGSYLSVLCNFLVLVAQFWTAVWPIGGSPSASYFFQQYLAAPVVLAFFLVHLIWRRPPWTPLSKIDLDTGRRDVDVDLLRQELADEKEQLQSRGFFYRSWKFWC